MECLDENALAAYLARQASDAEASRIEAHLATCEDCRALVEDAADLGEAPTLEPQATLDAAPPVLVRGASVGRYVLLRVLGEGGFGAVYAAHDPTLDRVVALKLLRADALGEDDDATTRFIREARAMARIEDPRVVTVHDAGEIDGRVFIAMELWDGGDLRAWLRHEGEEKRRWPEIVAVFVDAARGLVAAHAAGIVHRDFKPANVLRRKDGRVGVSDFGLARGVEEEGGEAAGTPAYMAPEQLRGEAATPASDQFALCVSLAEALAGEHPFAAPGAAVRDVIAAIGSGKRRTRLPRSVPSRIRRAVERGLSADPKDRFASIAELVTALAPDRRAPYAALAAGALLVASVGAGAAWNTHRAHACDGAAAPMRAIWNAETHAEVARAFAATAIPFADEAAKSFAERLDAYATRWSLIATDTCVATRMRGTQSEEVHDARMACLERARIEARTLVSDARSTPSRELVAGAGALRDLSECEDTASLLAQVKPPAAIRAAVAEVRAELAEARARRNAGLTVRADGMVDDALVRAKALDHAPLLAEALLAKGVAKARRGEHDAAQAALEDALRAASRGRHDRAAAETWTELVYVDGVLRGRPESGLALRAGAVAALDRIGAAPLLSARLASTTGLLEANRTRFEAALAAHRDAVRLYAEAGGADAPELGPELSHVSEMLVELGRWDEAAVTAEDARARTAASFGEHHPTIALPLTLLARRACVRRDGVLAEKLVDRALSVRTMPSTSPDDPTYLPMLLVHARAMTYQGRFDESEEDLSRARHIASTSFGATSAWAGIVGTAIGDALLERNVPEPAADAYGEAIRILDAAKGPRHPDAAAPRIGLGIALGILGRTSEALARLAEAKVALEEAFGPDSPLLVAPLVAEARALSLLRPLAPPDRERAVRLAERALALGTTGDVIELRIARDLVHGLAP